MHTVKHFTLGVAGASMLAAALAFAPAASGATQSGKTPIASEPGFGLFFLNPCTGQQVITYGADVGWENLTQTPNGGSHYRVHTTTVATLYASDVPPWDPSFTGFGPLVGTWTFVTVGDDQVSPDGHESGGFVSTGTLVSPDGATSHLQLHFHIVQPPEGPPTVFFVKGVCGG